MRQLEPEDFLRDVANHQMAIRLDTNLYRLSGSLEGERLAEVTEALQDEVLNQDNKYDLMISARDFKCGDFQFDSCELPDGKEYAYHFIWCLYAIVWGIQQYDAKHATTETTA